WRWTPTPEERLLAQDPGKPAAIAPPAPAMPSAGPTAPQTGGGPVAPTPGPPGVEAPEKAHEAPAAPEPAEHAPAPVEAATGADWPGFRGPARDGSLAGVRLATDWTKSPPVQL